MSRGPYLEEEHRGQIVIVPLRTVYGENGLVRMRAVRYRIGTSGTSAWSGQEIDDTGEELLDLDDLVGIVRRADELDHERGLRTAAGSGASR